MNRTPPLVASSDAQKLAATPGLSAWVAASAGTGKTWVLTDRVLRLLLAGAEPQRILCLTFTKAAAAEMANRLEARLARWAADDDAALAAEVERLTGAAADEALLRVARRLFARVLDTPGGMRVMTIHAFCQSLLRRFPLEAGIAPHFELMDERSAAELLHEARERVLIEARAGEDAALSEALAAVTELTGETTFAELMQALAGERSRLARLLRARGGMERVAAAIAGALDVEPGETAASVLAAACEDAALDLIGLRLAVEALREGSEADGERATAIAAWLVEPARRAAGFDAYAGVFLTKERNIRATLASKAVGEAAPHAVTVLEAEAQRLHDTFERLRAVGVARSTAALLRFGDAILAAYRRLKETRALMDYDDLVLAARDLLRRPGIAPWVLYKLDGGIDHILVDEAQDTNPEQWQVIAALAEEFFAGEGARDVHRTVFAVGDAKQSIFSFQGADPGAFMAMREHFKDRIDAARQAFRDVPLTLSFRSTESVLRAVDAVFAQERAQRGVALDGRPIAHEPWRRGQAGLVELWPPALAGDPGKPAPWEPPRTRTPGELPQARLARLVARRIGAMIAGREKLPARNRPVQAGDFMILLRQRIPLLEELVRALKQENVPVAGADRMVLTEQLAVEDLMALGEFLLMPEDDLTLAALLRSPLVGIDEEALFRLAYRRQGSLWAALRRREHEGFRQAGEYLSKLLARVDYLPPYDLYAEVLGPLGGRRALLARLGPEAADPIDEFLNLALQFERGHVPSLQGLLRWLASGAVEVKRDLEQGGGRVRVMTVHGAKGLQAPVVFLPDTMSMPRKLPRLLWLAGGATSLPLWSPRAALDDDVTAAARENARMAQQEESRRLLYVAMTRAEDRLYVCGWRGRQRAPEDCWYDLMREGLKGAEPFAFDCADALGAAGWQGEGRRLSNAQSETPEADAEAGPAVAPPPMPDWATAPPGPEPRPARPLSPSRLPVEEPAAMSPSSGSRRRVLRGSLVHRLLELLPELPAPERAAACRRFLAQPGIGLAPEEAAAIADETLRLLDDPRFAPLFGPGSLAEVALVGEAVDAKGNPVAVAGRIDRLAVGADEVLAIDFKTSREPPGAGRQVPEAYLWQLAAYRAVLRQVFPGKSITCGLLWTAVPELVLLPPESLDRCLP